MRRPEIKLLLIQGQKTIQCWYYENDITSENFRAGKVVAGWVAVTDLCLATTECGPIWGPVGFSVHFFHFCSSFICSGLHRVVLQVYVRQ